ncbi:MAG: hypothetical protein ACI89E_000427 [Planctomycetota bacterium]|jgi:hypothetical protein
MDPRGPSPTRRGMYPTNYQQSKRASKNHLSTVDRGKALPPKKLRVSPKLPPIAPPMTFRSSDPKPLAYLINASGDAAECRLVGLNPNHLVVFLPSLKALDGTLPMDLTLSLDKTGKGPNSSAPARLQGRSPLKDEYIVHLVDPKGFWESAIAPQPHNRRQAFRVRNLNLDSDRPQSNLDLTSRIEQGSSHFIGELMNTSLTGCKLRFKGERSEELPKKGSSVLLVLEGHFLAEPLRLPSVVMRTFDHPKHPSLGLRFQGLNNPAWLRIERQLQDYLMERQREQLRFRAA